MTLCDLAHIDVDQRLQAVDSISFAPVLVDGYQASPRHWLYTTAESLVDWTEALGKEHAIRKGSLKLISLQKAVDGTYQRRLYNLADDLKEERDLISRPRYQKDVKEMIKRLAAYAGPGTRYTAPLCNLQNCGSAQMLADQRVKVQMKKLTSTMPDIWLPICPDPDSDSDVTPISTTSVCPECGTNPNGEISCCGGTWKGKCGNEVGEKKYTWTDGLLACRCKCM